MRAVPGLYGFAAPALRTGKPARFQASKPPRSG